MAGIDDPDGDIEARVLLDVVDATLAGEPVDPAHAELAELALFLADERPAMTPKFAGALDQAVQRRFVRLERRPGGHDQAPAQARMGRRLRWWVWAPAGGLTATLVAAVVIVATGAGQPSSSSTATLAVASRPAHRAAPAAGGAASAAAGAAGAATKAPLSGRGSNTALSAPAAATPLQPPANGRKLIQGAQLSLTAVPRRIDQVAQEVFVVVGRVRGIVKNSTVTATGGPDGYAQFQLSIPSSMLPQAMASLSTLHYSKVASRTDTTQDVNDQYETDVRALADARALRNSLLGRLAVATTQAQIDSLTARIHDAEASIASDQATLRNLNRQINYSQVQLTINGGPLPAPTPVQSTGGFGLGQAAHDAGRVLTVAAGIGLIALAALIPGSLLGGLLWWIAVAIRRRRREQMLDLA